MSTKWQAKPAYARESGDMALFTELRRRNVIRVGVAYLVTAWLVVQVVATIAPAFDPSGWALRAVVIALTIGFFPALIFSWVFELTPEGLRRDANVTPDRAYTKRIAGKLDRIIIMVLTVAVGYFAIDKFLVVPARDESLIEQARLDALQTELGLDIGEAPACLPASRKRTGLPRHARPANPHLEA